MVGVRIGEHCLHSRFCLSNSFLQALWKLEIPGTNIFIDAQFINLASLYILCADRKDTLIEYNTDANILSGTTISTEALCMLPDELVLQMDCNNSCGVLLTGSRGSLRIITLISGVGVFKKI